MDIEGLVQCAGALHTGLCVFLFNQLCGSLQSCHYLRLEFLCCKVRKMIPWAASVQLCAYRSLILPCSSCARENFVEKNPPLDT